VKIGVLSKMDVLDEVVLMVLRQKSSKNQILQITSETLHNTSDKRGVVWYDFGHQKMLYAQDIAL
jgi:hypothetical protein